MLVWLERAPPRIGSGNEATTCNGVVLQVVHAVDKSSCLVNASRTDSSAVSFISYLTDDMYKYGTGLRD